MGRRHISKKSGVEVLDREATFYDFFYRQYRETPFKPCVRYIESLDKSAEAYTYHTVWTKAVQLANYLRDKHKIKPGTVVGVDSRPRTIQQFIQFLAINMCHATYLPIDREKVSDIPLLLRTTRTSLVLSQTPGDFMPYSVGVNIQSSVVSAQLEACSALEPPYTKRRVKPTDIAYYTYSSGRSTGHQKVMAIPQSGLMKWLKYGIRDSMPSMQDASLRPHGMKLASTTPIGFDPHIWDYCLQAVFGGEIYIIGNKLRNVGDHLLEVFKKYGITDTLMVPNSARRLGLIDDIESLTASGFRALHTTGECLTPEMVMRCLEAGSGVFNCWGPSEATFGVSVVEILSEAQIKRGIVSVGKPFSDDAKIYIWSKDGRKFKPVQKGEQGEIYLELPANHGVRGYVNDDKATSQNFTSVLFKGKSVPSVLFKTGDVGFWGDDDELYIVGRTDYELVKINGEKIGLPYIEQALKKHPGIKDVVVVKKLLQGAEQLVAYVIPEEDQTMPRDLRQWLIKQKMNPRHMPEYFEVIDRFPLIGDKVDKRQLIKRRLSQSNTEFHVGNMKTIALLQDIMREVRQTDEINPHLPLGLDSFDRGKLEYLLKQYDKYREVDLTQVLAATTIDKMASCLDVAAAVPSPKSSPRVSKTRKISTEQPLVFLVPGIMGVVDDDYMASVQRAYPNSTVYKLLDPRHISEKEMSMDELAQNYLQQIHRYYRGEPVTIVGWSFGCTVASVMRKQKSDIAIGDMCLIDGGVPYVDKLRKFHRLKLAAKYFNQDLVYLLKKLEQVLNIEVNIQLVESWCNLAPERQIAMLFSKDVTAISHIRRASWKTLCIIKQNLLSMCKERSVVPCEGHADVIVSHETMRKYKKRKQESRLHSVFFEETLGWRGYEFAGEDITCTALPRKTDHFNLFLGNILRDALSGRVCTRKRSKSVGAIAHSASRARRSRNFFGKEKADAVRVSSPHIKAQY